MRIMVVPVQLRFLAQQVRRAAYDLRATYHAAHTHLTGLDWEVGERTSILNRDAEASRLLQSLTDQAEALSNFLEKKAQLFDEAELICSTQVSQSLAPIVLGLLGILRGLNLGGTLPNNINKLLNLGSLGLAGVAAGIGVTKLVNAALPLKTADVGQSNQASPASTLPVSMPNNEVILKQAREALSSNSQMNSLWTQVDAPITNAAGQRTGDAYRTVIDQFDVEHSFAGRYRPGAASADTRCNIFAGDVMRAMNAPLPTKGDLGHGAGASKLTDPMTANATDIYNSLNQGWGGWRRIDPNNSKDLQDLLGNLQSGRPALMSDPGHIVVLRPDNLPAQLSNSDDLRQLHISQAGANNYNDLKLADYAAYNDAFKPNIFIHD